METLRDKFWLWGHSPESHKVLWKGANLSRMTPAEGAYYLGVKKIFMVCFHNHPIPPFDEDSMAMDSMDEVVWSITGDAGCDIEEGTLGHLEEILRIADIYPNITGAIFDDFFDFRNGERERIFTPDVLRGVRKKLAGKNLSMWLAAYDRDFDNPRMDYLNEFDNFILGIWRHEFRAKQEETIKRIRKITAGKPLVPCIYLGNNWQGTPVTASDIKNQLDLYARLLREGVTDGILFCSNLAAGMVGLETVACVKQWIKIHGDEQV
ncbi:MAG: hypothetical protein FWE82_06235 [Defluviitaleaceae bacterium]|nr:hypothetical protein [Defluviitaleaceae bacterium]